ncbi:MAG: hypothetical protein WA824_10475 [Candidatus Sulfotelmatobacter sp.]
MKVANSWITYRTRFLVKAKQLTTSLTFTDLLGRQHSGRKGDYLAEFSDGVLRILSREFFEDVYVPMTADQSQVQTNPGIPAMPLLRNSTDLQGRGFSRAVTETKMGTESFSSRVVN